ncbi:hypothetical protein HQ584_03405 [Patescibacteria group bacterium]|nr:hypothetical protein [Patescibacteria group bacterium]
MDEYFFVLKEGKHKFDILVRDYQQMYEKGEWPGFVSLWTDWEGDRWMLPHVCKWFKGELPSWLGKEFDENKLGFLLEGEFV